MSQFGGEHDLSVEDSTKMVPVEAPKSQPFFERAEQPIRGNPTIKRSTKSFHCLKGHTDT